MASIKCGNCKGTHESVSEVRACYGSKAVVGPQPSLPGFVGGKVHPSARIRAAAEQLPQVKSLRFALEEDGQWNFYQVDRPQTGKWRGYTFLKIQASDDFHSIRNLDRVATVLEALIERGIEKAVSDYGHQIGECGICHRTLTDPESIDRGIGPVCITKVGW